MQGFTTTVSQSSNAAHQLSKALHVLLQKPSTIGIET
jgi:hypothetical protein